MSDLIVDTMAHRYSGGVAFRMPTTASFIYVRVSNEALDDCEPSSRTNRNRIAIFERNRYAIEGVARRMLEARYLEEDGSILVKTANLNK